MRRSVPLSLLGLVVFCCGCPLASTTPRQACLNAGLSDAETDDLINQVAGIASDLGTLSRSEWTDFVNGLCVVTNCTDAEYTCLYQVGLQEIVE